MKRFLQKLARVAERWWFYPLLGCLLGFAYTLLDEGVLDELSNGGPRWAVLHEMLDAVFPVLGGLAAGFGLFYMKRLSRLNARLSFKKSELERELFSNLLISQMLHEIQNPIHNLTAALEGDAAGVDAERAAIVRKNLAKLSELKKQYGQLSASVQNLDPEEPTRLAPWLEAFVEDKLEAQFRQAGVRFRNRTDSLTVRMHPALMDQAFSTIFGNALEALEKIPRERREISFAAAPSGKNEVEIVVQNAGEFPPDVLEAAGKKMLPSRYGLGLGLLFLHKLVEQAGGRLSLANVDGKAAVRLTLKGAVA